MQITKCLQLVMTLGLLAGPAFPVDPVCKYLADLNIQRVTIPTHIYSTETAASTGGKMRTSEIIYLTDKTYIQMNGKWRMSPVTMKKMQDMKKDTETEGLADMTCRQVRDEVVNGEAATLYTMHKNTADEKSDSQVWISKLRHLPLKLEMDTDVGGGAGKSHRSMRYEYTNVQAPAGVQ
jgi:hypothetical protein